MKIPYKHLARFINSKPNISELSDKLFQLGHEHEIVDEIFQMEFTPNRGDCLSILGLLRDLKIFYDVKIKNEIYSDDIKTNSMRFINDSKDACSKISFLKIEIDEVPKTYKNFLNDYFSDLEVKKINFFTDISNFISYETGQPTHCYDLANFNEPIKLNYLSKNQKFHTLLDKEIEIKKGDLVFTDKNFDVINLAGIIGSKNTACNKNTKSVVIECAHFDAEAIIGKSVRYDINSDAAHKFERGTDPLCHEYVLRRFIKIVQNHCNINNIELFEEVFTEKSKKLISFDINAINKIIGTKVDEDICLEYLNKLGFLITKNMIEIPSHRNDINMINDIAEEVARAIGYDNILNQTTKISIKKNIRYNFEENKIKKLLINNGFYEVINNPFVIEQSKDSVVIDNPLDSNKKYLRTNLKNSLLENLLFNERRQKESIKLFEMADIYSSKARLGKKVIGIIASGRVDKNYRDFSKKISTKYLEEVLSRLNPSNFKIIEIPRNSLESKSKNPIIYCEIEIDSSFKLDFSYDEIQIQDIDFNRYIPISEFPSSTRDLSFSIKDISKCKNLEEFILTFKNSLLKEVYVFDYFKNKKTNEIKIGFRFIFQSKESTITDKQVDEVMNDVIHGALEIDTVHVPGLD